MGAAEFHPGMVFSTLNPYCVQLLDLLKIPRKTAPFLSEMARFLHRAPAHLLQPCLDYTLFPLLLLLDMGVQCRSTRKVATEGNFGVSDVPLKVLPISDNVIEGVLMCLEELLKKCHLGSVDQMTFVLKKLTHGALLSPLEASEEFREAIVRCFRALVLCLQQCALASCTCKQVIGSGPSLLSSNFQTQLSDMSECDHYSKECLLTFLRSQSASAAVGHWLSLLLQIAETESARGLRGSGQLREEALLTLRVLVAKVASADMLAFFLPGIVSRFAKALHVSKNMISGAAGSTGSIDHAVRGLAEFLMIVLNDEANLDALEESERNIGKLGQSGSRSSQLVLETLRGLPVSAQSQDATISGNSINYSAVEAPHELEVGKNNDFSQSRGSLHVNRTKEWIEGTSIRVNKLLLATFPHLSVHPSEKIRKGLVDGIRLLLSNCSKALVKSKLMLLECLCVLVCDDSEMVSIAAQEALESLFMVTEKYFTENEIAEIFNRLIESLPRVILGNEEALAVSHAQKLFALMYYVGPELVISHLLCSPVKASHLLDVLALCLSQNSVFSGSVEKLIVSKPLSVGYLHSVAELKACAVLGSGNPKIVTSDPFVVSKISSVKDKDLEYYTGISSGEYKLPRMPSWFSNVGSKKLYMVLAGMLRLIGLSVLAGASLSLSVVTDNPLDCLRKLISDIRVKDYYKEDWQSWYTRNGSGQLLRKTSTAVCILNEIIYGISKQSDNHHAELFHKNWIRIEEKESQIGHTVSLHGGSGNRKSLWKIPVDKSIEDQVIHCIGSILHEYMAPEIWDLPTDEKSFRQLQGKEADLSLHFFNDATMLHQVIIDGLGIFSLSLGKTFKSSGFLHDSLYLLLQNLLCSNCQVKTASDAVLHVLSAAVGHQTVGQLVVENADYIIDSLCRQLRHLDLSPHIPDVLSAVLSYIGVAHEILPLLEEPMRLVTLELEVLGRHQHPNLTDPFLKAIGEITKASRLEACELPGKAESFFVHTKSKLLNTKFRNHGSKLPVCSLSSENESVDCDGTELQLEQCEELLFKLNEMKRYRHIVGSVGASCLKAATPLLASKRELACLVALDIIEDGIITIAKVEGAYKHEKETKEAIEKAMQLYLFQDFQEGEEVADDADENRLLPAVNKIWPFLILSVKNKSSMAVTRRCMCVISNIVQICGGDFFVRRFHNDGTVIWKLLTTSPFRRKPHPSKDEKPLLLPYRSTCLSSEDSMAESSCLKIQEAVLNMIADISRNKKSAKAMEVVLKKVSGLVVGIACSSVTGLRDASLRALSGLVSVDSDLIWLLLADVYYSLKSTDVPQPSSSELPDIKVLLPTPLSSKEYLYLQYGGENFGFDVHPPSVELAFRRMQLEDFNR